MQTEQNKNFNETSSMKIGFFCEIFIVSPCDVILIENQRFERAWQLYNKIIVHTVDTGMFNQKLQPYLKLIQRKISSIDLDCATLSIA